MCSYLLYVKPFERKDINFLQIMNEITNWLLTTMLFLFTPIIDNGELQYYLGWVFLGIFGVNIIANISYIIYDIIKAIKHWYRKYKIFK